MKREAYSSYKSQSKGLGLGGIRLHTAPWFSNWILKFKLETKLPVLNQLRVCAATSVVSDHFHLYGL